MRGSILLAGLMSGCCLAQAEELSVPAASAALEKAVEFLRGQVSVKGSYLWRYSADLSYREGENAATPTKGWVQPPGTPSMGDAFLTAYEHTGEKYLLEAAIETARALVLGQLQSGGWDYSIEFDPQARLKFAYRMSPSDAKGKNVSTLDDNTTQSALRFLMRVDKTLAFQNREINECALYALEALLRVQYPNGAWPQRFEAPADPARHPVKPAAYPASWPREFPKVDYLGYYTLNDNLMSDMIAAMLRAWDCYGDARYRDSALRGGDFLLLAQMPEPQPAWAQQYDQDMHPAWARKFEPPSICGDESQSAMKTLIELAQKTQEPRFLDAIPPALKYFRGSLQPDGRLARFYELQTNKPLFFTKDYKLTYDPGDLPTHYRFFSGAMLDQLEAMYEIAKAGGAVAAAEVQAPVEAGLTEAARSAVLNLDERGAWISAKPLRTGGDKNLAVPTIDCDEVRRNILVLSAYIARKNPRKH